VNTKKQFNKKQMANSTAPNAKSAGREKASQSENNNILRKEIKYFIS